MHAHRGNRVSTDSPQHGVLEQASDSLLNAFARVRKPDPHFQQLSAELEKNEESMAQLRRVLLRNRAHIAGKSLLHRVPVTYTAEVAAFDTLHATAPGASSEDLSTDYTDFAASLDQLALLETGLGSTLADAAKTLQSYGELQAAFTTECTDTVLAQLQALHTHSQAHRAPLKLRESKQVDFESLTDYLAHEVDERDRLLALGGPHAAAARGNIRAPGVRGYLRSTVDKVWGVDEEQARMERLGRLDARIAELDTAVGEAHAAALAVNNHLDEEHRIYTLGRRREMHHVLTTYAEGHMAMYSEGVALFDQLLASLEAT